MDSYDDILGRYRSESDIEQVALATRQLLKVDDQVCPDVVWAIESELPKRFENVALLPRTSQQLRNDKALTSFNPPRIELRENYYRNPKHPLTRYVLAHELGHLMMHHGVLAKPLRDHAQERKIVARHGLEDQVDAFVCHFLAPKHIVSRFLSISEIIYECGLIYRINQLVWRRDGLLPRHRLQSYEVDHLQFYEQMPL